MKHQAAFTDQDASAEGRIVGIAKGTVNPVATMLRALRDCASTTGFTDPAWVELTEALHELYHADDDGEAMDCRDTACEALNVLMDRDYDGCGRSPNQLF